MLTQVVGEHDGDEMGEGGLRFPAHDAFGFRGVAEKLFDFGGAEVARIDFDVVLPIETDEAEGAFDEFADAVHFAGGDDVVVWLVLLEHEPHGLDVFPGVPPVAAGVQIAHVELLHLAGEDLGDAAGDLAGDEGGAAPGRFVVEEDAVAGKDVVGFAVLDGHVMGEDLGDSVGAARVEGCPLGLGDFLDEAEHLGGSGLVELDGVIGPVQGFEDAKVPHGDGIGGVFGHLKGDGDVALGAEVVDLIRFDAVDHAGEAHRVGEIAEVQGQRQGLLVGIAVDVLDAAGIETARTTDDAVDLVALGEKEFREVGAVLPRDSADQRFFCHYSFPEI